MPVLPILRMAYLIERDFAEFYRTAAARVEGKAKQALEMLALWETGHENLFKNLHDRAFEEYAQMPWGRIKRIRKRYGESNVFYIFARRYHMILKEHTLSIF